MCSEGRDGTISASGGTGRGGGGGGRVALDYERLQGVGIFYHGEAPATTPFILLSE